MLSLRVAGWVFSELPTAKKMGCEAHCDSVQICRPECNTKRAYNVTQGCRNEVEAESEGPMRVWWAACVRSEKCSEWLPSARMKQELSSECRIPAANTDPGCELGASPRQNHMARGSKENKVLKQPASV